jgi:hypothetical protein
MMSMRKRYLAWGLGLAMMAGCDSPSAAERFNPVGTLSFSYQGAVSGSFQATGEMEISDGTIPTPVTGATAYREDEGISLLAYQARGSSRGDAFALLLGKAEVGTLALNGLACQQQGAADCRVGVFLPDVDVADLPAATDPSGLTEKTYVLALGSVNVTARSRLRIKGTFTGIALLASDPTPRTAINVSGTFDLPIRPE